MQQELLILIAIVAALFVATMVFFKPMLTVFRVLEYGLVAVSIIVILGLMLYVSLEVVMRYGFNSPMGGHLELSELLILAVVPLALGIYLFKRRDIAA